MDKQTTTPAASGTPFEGGRTAGETAKWKPQMEGATMVIFRDCHARHNITHRNLQEEDYDWITRHCRKNGWLFTIRKGGEA